VVQRTHQRASAKIAAAAHAICTRFPVAASAMAKALRECPVTAQVSAICLHKRLFGAWYACYIG
jgi:hypothetical protein